MIQQSYEVLIKKIVEGSALSRGEVERKIELKLHELQDLISKEGAAHIIANELKVQLFDNVSKSLKIIDLGAGMNAVTVIGRVLNIYEPRTFTSGQRTGRVVNAVIGDETGAVKVVCWDETLINEFSKLKEGDILKVKNGYVKVSNVFKEVHLGSKAQIAINPENETVNTAKISLGKPAALRKKIKDFGENEVVEWYGTTVQIFEPKFYNACPVCKKKVFPQDSGFNCQEHGVVTAQQVPILNLFVDDGTGNIRAVCFREQAEKLIGVPAKPFEEVKRALSGKQLSLKGKVTKNVMFNRVEFVVSSVEEADPAKLIAELESA